MLELSHLFKVGSSFEEHFVVDSDDTVGHYSPHLASLLSTSGLTNRLLKILRDFCDQDLPEGYVTVAHTFHVTHLATVMIGSPLTAKIKLMGCSGNKLQLECSVLDDLGLVAVVHTERAIVAHDLLMQETERRRIALNDLERA